MIVKTYLMPQLPIIYLDLVGWYNDIIYRWIEGNKTTHPTWQVTLLLLQRLVTTLPPTTAASDCWETSRMHKWQWLKILELQQFSVHFQTSRDVENRKGPVSPASKQLFERNCLTRYLWPGASCAAVVRGSLWSSQCFRRSPWKSPLVGGLTISTGG